MTGGDGWVLGVRCWKIELLDFIVRQMGEGNLWRDICGDCLKIIFLLKYANG